MSSLILIYTHKFTCTHRIEEIFLKPIIIESCTMIVNDIFGTVIRIIIVFKKMDINRYLQNLYEKVQTVELNVHMVL